MYSDGKVRCGEEVFYRTMIRSQSLGEPVPQEYELHQCFSVHPLSPPPLKRCRMARSGLKGISLPLVRLESGKIVSPEARPC